MKHTIRNSSSGSSKPPIGEEPPINNLENQAQKSGIGGTGCNGRILPTLIGGQERQINGGGNQSTANNNHIFPFSSSIYRLGHSDTFACHNCKQKGDKWLCRNTLV